MLLYCVRHGQSLYNAEGRVQGQSDVPLSDFGRRQSEATARALADRGIEALYSSPLRRAMQTAEVVAARLGLEIRTDPRLREVDAGIFQDKLRTELAERYPEELARWTSGDPDFTISGGESRRALARRGCAALEAIRGAGHGRAAVVSHGRLMTVTLEAMAGLPKGQPLGSLHNGSITTVRFGDHGRGQVIALNEVDHLAEVGVGGLGDL